MTWTATHDTFTADGTMTIDLAAGAAQDLAGNANPVAATQFHIFLDTTPPLITLLGANPQHMDQGATYSELNASALDDRDGDISGSIVIDSSAVDPAVAGTYAVTYNVQDAVGNAAVEHTRTVVVVPRPHRC